MQTQIVRFGCELLGAAVNLCIQTTHLTSQLTTPHYFNPISKRPTLISLLICWLEAIRCSESTGRRETIYSLFPGNLRSERKHSTKAQRSPQSCYFMPLGGCKTQRKAIRMTTTLLDSETLTNPAPEEVGPKPSVASPLEELES